MPVGVKPIRIEIPETDLTDLRDRLRRTRWPDPEPVDDWSQGIPLAYVQELRGYWADRYDWQATEARLNELPQFRTDIDGLGVHLLHVRSPHGEALPLIIAHGWPGSVVEFLKVIGPLTGPPAHGGDAGDAFQVVCPSLPEYGFSDKPTEPGWNTERIARGWAELLARLGYGRCGAQGGDWATAVTTNLGRQDVEHLAGIHINMPVVGPDRSTFGELTEREQAVLASMPHCQDWDSRYSKQQSTRPQTLGYGLVDSPAGQCAWIVEKFWAWTDCDGHPETVLNRDELLDNVMMYWPPATGASSARLYWEGFNIRNRDTVPAPAGVSIFPKEIFRASRRWAEKRFTDLRYWNELDKGGHLAAFEQPTSYVDDVRAFFRLVRGG